MSPAFHESLEMKRAPYVLVGACSALLFTAGCTTADSGGGGAPAAASSRSAVTATSAACRVTEPTRSGVPTEVAAQGYGNVFGDGRLWVGAWWADADNLDQVRSKGLAEDGFPYREKYPTWTVDGGKVSAAAGAPQVSVRRLDAPAQGTGDVGGYASEPREDATVSHWWPTVVGFSDTGCWQVTETVRGDSITYVVHI